MSVSSGIYAIVNTVTGEEYIGRSTNIKERWTAHRRHLNGNGAEHTKQFVDAWRTYGAAAFVFTMVEEVPYPPLEAPSSAWQEYYGMLGAREVYHLNQRKPAYNGPYGRNWVRGRKSSEEVQ